MCLAFLYSRKTRKQQNKVPGKVGILRGRRSKCGGVTGYPSSLSLYPTWTIHVSQQGSCHLSPFPSVNHRACYLCIHLASMCQVRPLPCKAPCYEGDTSRVSHIPPSASMERLYVYFISYVRICLGFTGACVCSIPWDVCSIPAL